MNLLTRLWRFNLVGVLGFALQTVSLAFLHHCFPGHDLLASAAAVELTLLHNFLWHLRYTWRDRRSASPLVQLARFHLSNGLVSLAGNLLIVHLLRAHTRLPLLAANTIAVLCCALVNFYLGNVWAFAAHRPPKIDVVGLSNLNLNQFAQYIVKAEALIEEITLICKDMPKIDVLGTGASAEMEERPSSQQNPRKKRLYTPPLT